MDQPKSQEAHWKWRFSFWTGIMYGPVPVGLIVVVIVFLYFMVRLLVALSD
jgi:hypothetical protein